MFGYHNLFFFFSSLTSTVYVNLIDCFTVHFNSLNVTHQLMHFQYNNILV